MYGIQKISMLRYYYSFLQKFNLKKVSYRIFFVLCVFCVSNCTPVRGTRTNLNNEKKRTLISLNLLELGAKGDGNFDNWEIIQRAIDSLARIGGGELIIPQGIYAVYDKTLSVWGSNIAIRGIDAEVSTIVKKGKVGSIGDCLVIMGKIPKYVYHGNFGEGNYVKPSYYRGILTSAFNITISNLKIRSELDIQPTRYRANNLGIINSKNVTIENCIFEEAPQSNAVVVNDANIFKNENISFKNCTFRNSGKHNVRVTTINQGKIIGNYVNFTDCAFLNVRNADDSVKELRGKKVNIWYRGGIVKGTTALRVNRCLVDSSGIIYANSNTSGLSIIDSKLQSGIYIYHTIQFENNPIIEISNISYDLKKSRINNMPEIVSRSFTKHNNLYIFPATLINSSTIKF